MERSRRPCQLSVALLAATIIGSLSINAADAQSDQPRSPSTAQEEPIKRTVRSEEIWKVWRGKRSSSSSRKLHPEQWAQSITTQALSSFMCSKAHWLMKLRVMQRTR
jgi:hypothetical protein